MYGYNLNVNHLCYFVQSTIDCSTIRFLEFRLSHQTGYGGREQKRDKPLQETKGHFSLKFRGGY